jgi:CcmD family protein
MLNTKRFLGWVVSALVMLLVAVPAIAQESALPGSGLAGQSLRPYAFVFIAYAIAWIFVLGWVVSVGRRMSGLARRLDA